MLYPKSSSDTNSRGESLFEFTLGEDLFICNMGSALTFVTAPREEARRRLGAVTNMTAPGLTLISSSLVTRIKRCSVPSLFPIIGTIDL